MQIEDSRNGLNQMIYRNSKKYSIFFLLLAALGILAACDSPIAEKRAKKAAEAKGDIFIGIVQTSLPANFFLEGVRMAVEEINQQGGLLGGRKVRTVICDDHGDPDEAERIARELSADKNIVAVIGHRMSSAAIPASIIYEQAGIVFISYGANAPGLTQYSGGYTFRNIPSNKDYGLAMAKFLYDKGLRKTMVFHDREDTQKNLADIFKKYALDKGIEIVATRSYFNEEEDFKEPVAFLKKQGGFDSLAIFGLMPAAAYLLKELDTMGVKCPIIAGSGLDYPELFTIAGGSAEGVAIPAIFDPSYPDKRTREFVKKFQEKFNVLPDQWAAQGYDAVSLLAHTVEKSETVIPAALASSLRFLEKWQGVTGSYSFVPEGDIKNKEIYFKKVKNGKFIIDTGNEEKTNPFKLSKGFTLPRPLKTLTTLDPGLSSNESDMEVAEQLFLGLTDFDPKMNMFSPELAENWEKNKEIDTLYYFTMRKDVTWTNGEPVTAHDVVWAIERNLNPATKSPYVEKLFILKNAENIHFGKKNKSELGVSVIDNFSLIFELEHAEPSFPAMVSHPVFRPLPKAVLELHREHWTDADKIQTNGPYKLSVQKENARMFLEKNSRYFAADEVSTLKEDYDFIIKKAGKFDLFNYLEDLTLRLPLKKPVTTLDPGRSSNESDVELAEQLFLGLTGIDPKTNDPIPELATWEKNKLIDTLYYFAMRKDVTWSDGKPVTAHDVLWAIKRNLDPKTQSPQVEELYILKNARDIHLGRKRKSELRVYAVDDFALVFELEHPDPSFPARVSLPIFRPLPKSVIEQYKKDWTDLDKIQINGPYKPAEWRNIGIFLKKNPGYFAGEQVAVPEVRYFVIARDAVGLAMYENNELDVVGGKYLSIPAAAVSGLKKSSMRDEYYEVPTTCTYAGLFNTELPPFDLPFVRKAISAAIDRQLLIDAANSGLGEPAAACTPPHLLVFPSADVPTDPETIFDPEQAQKWLAEAGYPNGKGFPELILVTTKSKFDANIARGIQTLLKHYLHISVSLKTEDGQDGDDAVEYDKSIHMVMRRVCSDYPSPDSILKKLQKATNWKNEQFNKLINKARHLAIPEKRLETYIHADKMLCQEEAAVIPLFYATSPLLIKAKVQGWTHAAMGGQQLHQYFFEEQ